MEPNDNSPLQRLQTRLQSNFATFASLQTPIHAFANLQTLFQPYKNHTQ